MLLIEKTKKELKDNLDDFIWEFKVGDNIEYNLELLYILINDYNESKKDYKKPISIIAVSIIEAIMVDFLYRLYNATSHFPIILKDREDEIKNKLINETIKTQYISEDGEKHYYSTLRNFNFVPMVQVYEDLKLLGDSEKIYESLINLSFFRNRVHIINYYNNFEKDENITFSESRTQKTLNIMICFFKYFKEKYNRPWPDN